MAERPSSSSQLGFSADVPQLLIDALRSVAHTAEVVEIVQSSHGEE